MCESQQLINKMFKLKNKLKELNKKINKKGSEVDARY
jgi:hypothetical protein